MTIALFYHSLLSDWNHGNAHFLRGIATELRFRGHEVRIFEPNNGWSLSNLLSEHGPEAVEAFRRHYPGLQSTQYDLDSFNPDEALDGVDLVIVHEWNAPELLRSIGDFRTRNPSTRLLFHDTHHRAVSKPERMEALDLGRFDGVLAYGQVLTDIYMRRGWCERAWTWHEAADVRVFRPRDTDEERESAEDPPEAVSPTDLIWIGNWGDDERTRELEEFLLAPARDLGLAARAHGVRYPPEALGALERSGIEYLGWIANYNVPLAFSSARVTVHIPRRPYVQALPGIPTIRPFEALACGIPLVCSPWRDSEGLFTPGKDYLVAEDGGAMRSALRAILNEPELARELAEHGRRTIHRRHTCAHRVDELLEIAAELGLDAPHLISSVSQQDVTA